MTETSGRPDIDAAFKPRLHAWMRRNGWRITEEAGGLVHWQHENSDHVWLDEVPTYAVVEIAHKLTGEMRPARYEQLTERPEFETVSVPQIIVMIAMSEPEPQDVDSAKRTTGGVMILDGSTVATDSWVSK